MKRLSTFLAVLLCAVTTIFADAPFRNHRYDAFKVLDVTSDNIVFIGNSITDMHCWPEAFVTSTGEYLPIVNRGNSGTYSTEQSDNLESYIYGKPKKVFMMIGTNDIATSGGLNFSPEQVLSYVKSIVTRIHARSPQTKVYLYSILKNNTSNRVEATWLKANELIKSYAEVTDKVTYIDLYDKLAGVADGGAWSYDNLHLTAGAYQAWCETICQYLQEGEDYTVSCVYPENTLTLQNAGGLGGSHGMRGTYFSCLPIKSDDVLVFGDSFVKNGEWQELLGNRNVKNRGTGWGNSGDIATTSGIVDATFATIEGVSKTAPKAIFLYTGTGDCTGSTDIATVKDNYKALVDKIAEKSPTSKIYLMAICPRNNASHNTRIAELNAYMESLVSDDNNIRFVDTYTPMLNEGAVNSKYVFSNDYIGGLAYVKIANLMKTALLGDFSGDTYTVSTEEEAEARYTQAGLRNQLTQTIARGLVAERGDEAGQYNATQMKAYDTKVAEANTILEKTDITQDEVTTFADELNTILNDALSMPTYSTESTEVWYQLYTPNRGNKYLQNNGADTGVTGEAVNNYAKSMWKFVLRGDGTTLDIINRKDNSYLAPTATGSNPLTMSASQPTNGWTLSYSDAPGLFIVNSGTVQLHQTNNAAVWNWGGGTNRSDAGCQYMVSLVENEPDIEFIGTALELTTTQFDSGVATWTRHTATSGGWYGKFVTATAPSLTVESTNLTADNLGWSNKRPWLQQGYTYNFTLPEGYIITGYELTTLGGNGYTGTFTYTTATGTAESEAQSETEQKTVVTGLEVLNTNQIQLTVNGSGSTAGIMIPAMKIYYKVAYIRYTVDKTNGNLYNSNGSANQNWNNAWKSNAMPQLQFSCGANNMNWYNETNVQMMTGSAQSSTYTLTAPAGYVISKYSFTFANNGHDTGLSLTMTGGNTYTTTRAAQTISAFGQNASTVSFTLAGNNGYGVVLTDFTVMVMDSEIANDPELIAAKSSAKESVTANAAHLNEAIGYYSYTIGGVKVYDAERVVAAIYDATTIAEVEAIIATYSINLPEVGKYYRIGYDFGGNAGVKYMQSTNSPVKGLAMTADKGEGSIFLVEEIDGNLRLKSMSTGKYLKEDGGTRGLHDVGGNVTFTEGADGKIKIQATSYLHPNVSGDNYFIDHCGSDGCAEHNLIVEEVKVRSLTVEGPAYVGASATWNAETKALPATWAIFDGITITSPTLSINCPASYTFTGFTENGSSLDNTVEIASLTANRTITANFNMAFFSASTEAEDLMPVRIRSARNTTYTLRLNANDSYTGKAVNSGVTAYGENELWYLVGTEESFKIYNRVAGTDLHIVLAGTSGGSAASMNTTADNADFCLVAKDNGYAICPKANTGQSFNMHGGAGNDIKLYGAGDGGSIWTIEKMDVDNPVTLNVEVDQVWESSPRVAELTFTIDGLAGQTRILGSVEGQALYLPAGAAYEVSSMTYRGYTYNGCTEEDGVLTASYTANDERTLFYTPGANGHPYRIPAIATAPNGDIFAICDFRPCRGDIGNGDVDIVCRISSDNGVTWDDEIVLANGDGGSTNRMETGYGDPAIVADRESNKILVMMVAGRTVCGDSRWDASKIGVKDAAAVNRAARVYGTLNESTGEWEWTQPEEVTDDIYKLFLDESNNATVTSYFIGSGKICQSRVVKKGEYYRLYCALWTRDGGNRVIYSDDFGGSWHVLGTINDRPAPNGNEPKCEELPDGTVILSSRVAGGRFFNLFTFADNTYTTGTWGTVANSTTVRDGSNQGTNGEIYKVKAIRKEDGKICDVMLQSVPAGPARTNVTVWYKEMDYTTAYTPATFAADWKVGKKVSDTESAYSTMHLQADGRIGFFFEEAPGGYTMVYIPYTLEDLTAGQYSLYTVTSSITAAEIGTFYASEAMTIPEGVKAYVATERPTMEDTDVEGNATGYITMTELKGIIPAHTGAVLRGEAATYKFIPSISYGNAVEGNMLVGYEAENTDANSSKEVTVAADYTTYVLTVQDEKIGFYRKEKGTFNVFNNKAYLDLTDAAQGVRSLAIRFEGDGSTGIENSEFTIQNSEFIYDLMGRRVENPAKGVYIVNGKKVVK